MIQDKTKYTSEEYLAREEKAEYKSEYYGGEIRMMAGGTPEHSIAKGNVVTALNNALDSLHPKSPKSRESYVNYRFNGDTLGSFRAVSDAN